MERRKFMLGAGSTAIGASALVGSGAFTSMASQRTVSVRTAHDENAYMGLKEVPDSPNSSYVDFDDGNLQIRMDEANPNLEDEDLGTGVNADSITIFNDLFRIKNQGTQTVFVFAFLLGDETDRVGLYTEDFSPVFGLELEVGEYEDIGLITNTLDIPADTQLVEDMVLVSVGENNPEDGDYERAAQEYAPDDAEANETLPDDD